MAIFCPNDKCTQFRRPLPAGACYCRSCGGLGAQLTGAPLRWPISVWLIVVAVFVLLASAVAFRG